MLACMYACSVWSIACTFISLHSNMMTRYTQNPATFHRCACKNNPLTNTNHTYNPTPGPPFTFSDSTVLFDLIKPDGTKINKSCDWVKMECTAFRCKHVIGAKENCPKTCTNCCQDTIGKFLLSNGKSKSCEWAGAEDTEARCNKSPTRIKCAVTCGAYGCSGSN